MKPTKNSKTNISKLIDIFANTKNMSQASPAPVSFKLAFDTFSQPLLDLTNQIQK